MSTPYEIIAAPLTLWLAPVGTAYPLINAVPAVAWVKIGTSGDNNYSDDGVTVSHNQSFEQARPAGSLGPRKAFRTEEDQVISLTLWDMTLEQVQLALGGVMPTTTAAGVGQPGIKKIGLSRGRSVKEYALLARGASPYQDETMSMQWEVPRVYQSGSPETAFKKGTPAGVALEFTALEDLAAANDSERFGRLFAQHQLPL